MVTTFSTALERIGARYAATAWMRWLALVFFAVVSVSLVTGGTLLSIPYRIDLDVYRIGGHVWLSGGELYGAIPPTQSGVGLPFTYPPIAAVLFSALSWVPLSAASAIFTALSIAAFFAAVMLVLRQLSGWSSSQSGWVALPITGVMLLCEPMLETLSFGQINAFLFLLVVADVVAGRGKRWQGALIGLAMAIKLTPAVFLAYFLMRRDWRAILCAMVSALTFTGLGFLAAPRDSVQYWTETLRDTSRIGGLAYASNQSFNGLYFRLGLEGSSAAWFISCAVVGLGLLAVMWKLFHKGDDLTPMLLMGFYALVASPVSWSHHWLWSVPAILVAFAWARSHSGYLVLALSGVAVFFSHVIWWFPHKDGQELQWNLVSHIFGNSYTWWALAFMAVACWRAWQKDAQPAVAQ